MALAPQFSGHRLGSIAAAHTIELYLDYVVSHNHWFFKLDSLITLLSLSVLFQLKCTKRFAR